ncbi:MAG: acyltransferase [Proteiniphilum sp.]|jgi:predicted LPLAT superfamily acyltransferase|nr:acyltransferase [Proteiniphilum sp.]
MNGNNGKEWSGKTRGGSFGYRFFIVLIDRLGVRFAYVFLAFVVIYFIPFAPKATVASWWYARNILKKSRFRSSVFLFANYYRFGQTLIDKVAVSAGKKDRYEFVFDESYPRFLEMLNQENGAIMVSAHVGNWEIGAPFFDKYGKKMHVAMLDAEYRKIKKMLEQHSENRNYNVLPLDETDGLSNIFRAKAILDRREFICFQGDRFLGNTQTAEVGFLGKTARFPVGPFLLASRLRVPVIFYFSMREQGAKYKFYFQMARIESTETGKSGEPGTESAVKTGTSSGIKPEILLLEQYVRALEDIVRKYPHQWFNYYRFWKGN